MFSLLAIDSTKMLNAMPSFSVHTPDPFLSPAPVVGDDVESPLEICHYIVGMSITFESGIFKFFV